tara:strand:- start:125 stop:751 length:627 start_codon:yes stop_codon:yes gene_type:complete
MDDNSDSFTKMNPNVSRETIEQLKIYRQLIIDEKSNLVSNRDKEAMWIRHFHDSLRILDHISLENSHIIDVGTGAGLPGIPISLCLKDSEHQIYLCESKKKKIDFLLKCKEKLKLSNVEVIPDRVENVKNKKFDYVIGRAVAQLNTFFSMSYNVKKENTIFLLHKGIHIDKEIEHATKYWDFEHYLHENIIEKGSFIIEIKKLIKSIS